MVLELGLWMPVEDDLSWQAEKPPIPERERAWQLDTRTRTRTHANDGAEVALSSAGYHDLYHHSPKPRKIQRP